VLAEIATSAGDYDVPKHRWSAFHGTHLELSRASGRRHHPARRRLDPRRIASTAFDARDRDFQKNSRRFSNSVQHRHDVIWSLVARVEGGRRDADVGRASDEQDVSTPRLRSDSSKWVP